MVEEVTLDSSVLVSALVMGDEFRPIARRVMEKVFLGEYRAVMSAGVSVEVCGSISRRAGVDKAIAAKNQLIRWEDLNLISYRELTAKRRGEAEDLAIKLKMRGMDAIVVQAAKEGERILITFDEEMAKKARVLVGVFTHKDFIDNPPRPW